MATPLLGEASIIIDQATLPPGVAGVSRDDGVIGELVTLRNATGGNENVKRWQWVLLKPRASAASLSSLNSASCSFTPDVDGTYTALLFVNEGRAATQRQRLLLAVKSAGGFRYPAQGESNEANWTSAYTNAENETGWWEDMDAILRANQANIDGTLLTVETDAALANSRRLQFGASISAVDGGPGGDLTISVAAGWSGVKAVEDVAGQAENLLAVRAYDPPVHSALKIGQVVLGADGTTSNDHAAVLGGSGCSASGIAATVAGGITNTASGRQSFVGAGTINTASGEYSCVVAGSTNAASGAESIIGAGTFNLVSGDYGVVAGGGSNNVNATYATISGGGSNTASASHAAVGGGFNNTASGAAAAVAGGSANVSSGEAAAVAGGQSNTASGDKASIGGGGTNNATADNSTIGGGSTNTASAVYATVAGGNTNTASGADASVGGGFSNTSSAPFASIGGGFTNTVGGDYSVIGGGNTNSIATSTNAVIGGGSSNSISGNYGAICGGSGNQSNATYNAICGGLNNICDGSTDFIGGGSGNNVTGDYGAICGGQSNTAGLSAFVGAGGSNTASGEASAIPGGSGNTASGSYSSVIGRSSSATATDSVAVGRAASSTHAGSIVMTDGSGTGAASSVANQLVQVFAGGIQQTFVDSQIRRRACTSSTNYSELWQGQATTLGAAGATASLLVLPTGQDVHVRGVIKAKKNSNSDACIRVYEGMFVNVGGVITTLTALTNNFTSNGGGNLYSATFGFTGTTGTVSYHGVAATTVYWTWQFEFFVGGSA